MFVRSLLIPLLALTPLVGGCGNLIDSLLNQVEEAGRRFERELTQEVIDEAERVARDEAQRQGGDALVINAGEGLDLRIDDESSPIYGASVSFPAGALPAGVEAAVLAIFHVPDGDFTDHDVTPAGETVDIILTDVADDEPVVLVMPATVGVPYDERGTGHPDELHVAHGTGGGYELLDDPGDGALDLERRLVYGTTSSFSPFGAVLNVPRDAAHDGGDGDGDGGWDGGGDGGGDGCAVDALEPNDQRVNAFQVGLPYDARGLVAEGHDWYRFYVEDGSEISIDALGTHGPDPRIKLYGPDGAFMTEDWGAMFAVAGAAGEYRIDIVPDGGPGTCVEYDLGIDAYAPPGCETDYAEPNDGVDSASYFGEGFYDSLSLPPDDVDYYRTFVGAGNTLYASAYPYDGASGLRVELYDVGGGWLADGVGGVNFTQAAAGDVVIGVFSDEAICREYDLDIYIQVGGGGTCTDDWMEPNDSMAEGYWVSPGYYSGLNVRNDDFDYVQFGAAIGDFVQATAYGYGSAPTLCMLDTAGAQIGCAVGATYGFYPAVDGTYTIEISTGSATCEGYDLDLVVTPPGCADDAYEDNDDSASATHLGDVVDFDDGAMVLTDEDWFAFSLDSNAGSPRDYVFETYDPLGHNADTTLTLYRDLNFDGVATAEEQVTYSDDYNGTVQSRIDFAVDAGMEGDYFLAVRAYGANYSCLAYGLKIGAAGGF